MNAVNLIHPLRASLPWLRAWLAARVIAPVPVRVTRSLATFAAIALLAAFDTALGLTLFAGTAAADVRRSNWEETADGRLVDVQIEVGSRRMPLYARPGDHRNERWYFQAFEGRNYALRLRNNTGRRVGVVIAVDGLNVVNGERARLSGREPMYVLDPYETTTIRGWRTSLDDVRRFVFVDEERSYAERTGQANRDMGWIRVLTYEESRPYGGHIRGDERWKNDRDDWEREESRRDDRFEGRAEGQARAPEAAPAPTSEAAPRVQKGGASPNHARDLSSESAPGTGWGERRHDPVQRTQFVARGGAVDHLVFRYEYADGLRALGIEPIRSRVWERDRGDLGFARPPRW